MAKDRDREALEIFRRTEIAAIEIGHGLGATVEHQ